jgi:hypothetical protein
MDRRGEQRTQETAWAGHFWLFYRLALGLLGGLPCLLDPGMRSRFISSA